MDHLLPLLVHVVIERLLKRKKKLFCQSELLKLLMPFPRLRKINLSCRKQIIPLESWLTLNSGRKSSSLHLLIDGKSQGQIICILRQKKLYFVTKIVLTYCENNFANSRPSALNFQKFFSITTRIIFSHCRSEQFW